MARKLNAQEIDVRVRQSPDEREIALYAAYAGAGDRGASALRRALQLPVSPRVWYRVFPYLPREVRTDGSLILWHPDEQGWAVALERVHARLALNGRKSGAYLLPPGSDRVMLRDFHDFDEADLNDWSIAVPDPHFRALCGHLQGDLCRLSELVARWALEVGPMRAGQALAVRGGPLGQPLS
jgi:hypothetical protein